MPTKPKQNYAGDPSKLNQRDFFQTPNYATKLLLPYIPCKVNTIWECANGNGKISKILSKYYKVFTSDIELDFTRMIYPSNPDFQFDCIISNPPFSIKRLFAERCIAEKLPWALLMPLDFSGWICDLIEKHDIQLLVPNRRIDYITPTGLSGKASAAQFHSAWYCYKFNLPKQITIVELTTEMKKDI